MVQKGFQVFRVGARIRLSLVHGVRVIGGVSDLIGLLTPHDTQRAFLSHALPLALRADAVAHVDLRLRVGLMGAGSKKAHMDRLSSGDWPCALTGPNMEKLL